MRFILFLVFGSFCGWAQPKFEIVDFSGKLRSIDSYWNFAQERLTIDVDGEDKTFLFHPKYGELMRKHFKPGNSISVRVKLSATKKQMAGKVSNVTLHYWFRDYIVAVWVDGVLHELDEDKAGRNGTQAMVHLDKTVRGEVVVDGLKRGFVFDDGLIGYNYFQGFRKPINQDVKPGDVVTFVGYEYPRMDGFTYPVENTKRVFHFNRLYKDKGTIKSLLFKQNNVCIGLVFSTGHKQIRLAFPSNYAERIKKFADNAMPVTAYFDEPEFVKAEENDLNPPGLYALIQEKDTIKINEYGFWGGADIKHEHIQTTAKGKITQVNRLESGTIYSVILDNESYIDIDHATQKQLGKFFKRGAMMTVGGKERIKAPGEIYNKPYRIMTPDEITIDDTVFQINQLP